MGNYKTESGNKREDNEKQKGERMEDMALLKMMVEGQKKIIMIISGGE